MAYTRNSFIAVQMLMLAACSEPRIDASTSAKAQTSSVRVREALSGPPQMEFDQLMDDAREQARAGGGLSKLPEVLADLNGLTGPEAITKVREIRKRRLNDYERQIRDRESEVAQLGAVAISDVVVTPSADRLKASLTATITNGLPFAIRALQAEILLRSDGRDIPWDARTHRFYFDGGIEHKESRQVWAREPLWAALLGRAIAEHPDARIEAKVVEVTRADHSVLPTTSLLTSAEQEDLRKLRQKLGVVEATPDSISP